MNKSNYDNFNYDNYNASQNKILGAIQSKLKNPIFATAVLLLSGAAFAAVIIASYPSSEEAADIPVIQAETMAFKELPTDRGGMNVPFQDSTVYSSLRNPNAQEVTNIENLLAEEEPVDRLEAFAAEAERIIQESEARRSAMDTTSLIEQATGVQRIPQDSSGETLDAVIAKAEVNRRLERELQEPQMPQAQEEQPVPPINTPLEKPETLFKPGSSPDTIEFAREALEKKDAPQEAVIAKVNPEPAKKAAAVEPAAGGFDIRPGSHFVQLASIKDAAAAGSEWAKLSKKYPAELSGTKYRVERADLGSRGVFFRIQAGPMAKDSATKICTSIKAKAPGACLVTQ